MRLDPEEIGSVFDALASTPRETTDGPPPSLCRALRLNLAPSPGNQAALFRSIDRIDPALRTAIRSVVTGRAPWPLFVWGEAGTGKTCAGLSLIDHCAGPSVFCTASDLASTVIEAQQGRLTRTIGGGPHTTPDLAAKGFRELSRTIEVSPDYLWGEIGSAALVVLDEIGSRSNISDHHYECVKKLLDFRHGRPLMALSNRPLGDLAKLYDDRVASRLAAGTVVHLGGDDRRITLTSAREHAANLDRQLGPIRGRETT